MNVKFSGCHRGRNIPFQKDYVHSFAISRACVQHWLLVPIWKVLNLYTSILKPENCVQEWSQEEKGNLSAKQRQTQKVLDFITPRKSHEI